MKINLTTGELDDHRFIDVIGLVIDDVISSANPREVYIIRIDRWFDHKWLKFSGIGVVIFPTLNLPGSYIDSALDEFSQDKTTFPPFTPNRVIEQRYFHQNEAGFYVEREPPQRIHQEERQRSSDNLQRRVSDFSDSAIFAWYNSGTLTNDRGSLMVYIVNDGSVKTWFAAFRKDQQWKLDRVKDVNREEILKVTDLITK